MTIQWLISLRKGFDIEFAAILNSLALIPSSPVALCGGIDTRISATSLVVIYGILSALSLVKLGSIDSGSGLLPRSCSCNRSFG